MTTFANSLAIHTNLSRNLDEEGRKSVESTSDYWKTLDQGAATTLVAAYDPRLEGKIAFIKHTDMFTCTIDCDGTLLHDCQFIAPAAHASDLKVADRLWRLSEQLVGESFPFVV